MIRPFLLATLALAATPAFAQTQFQSTTLLDTAVMQFTGKQLGDEGGAIAPVDARLKLAQCALPQLEWRNARQDAVVVRCMSPAWRIFVPVRNAPQATMAVAAAVPMRAAPAAKPKIVVKRGDPVMIEAGSPGFSITRDGVAMGDAPAGGRLMVRVEQNKPPIQAIALEAGRVTLPGWDS